MNKKFISILTLSAVLTLTACGTKTVETTAEPIVESIVESTAETTVEPTEETTVETTAETSAEDLIFPYDVNLDGSPQIVDENVWGEWKIANEYAVEYMVFDEIGVNQISRRNDREICDSSEYICVVYDPYSSTSDSFMYFVYEDGTMVIKWNSYEEYKVYEYSVDGDTLTLTELYVYGEDGNIYDSQTPDGRYITLTYERADGESGSANYDYDN